MPKKIKTVEQECPVVNREFADENARIAWEIGQAVNKAVANLPVEAGSPGGHPISFPSGQGQRGFYAILFAGTMIGTPRAGVYVVPDRTLHVLDSIGITYRIES